MGPGASESPRDGTQPLHYSTGQFVPALKLPCSLEGIGQQSFVKTQNQKRTLSNPFADVDYTVVSIRTFNCY